MTRESDDHALRWSGDDDPSLVSGDAPAIADDAAPLGAPVEGESTDADDPETAVPADTLRPEDTTAEEALIARPAIEDAPVEPGSDALSPVTAPDAEQRVDFETRAQVSSVELILLGFLGGVYLLFTIGWIVSLLPRTVGADDPVAQAMAVASSVFAVLAPALWAVTTFWIARKRPMLQRIGWLALGVLFIVPWPFIGGAL